MKSLKFLKDYSALTNSFQENEMAYCEEEQSWYIYKNKEWKLILGKDEVISKKEFEERKRRFVENE